MWLYIWLGVTVVALVLEFITNDIVTVWFAGGGLVAMILSALGVSWYIHLPAFMILSFVLLLCFRKAVLKRLNRGDEKTNADVAVGQEYSLLTPIEFGVRGSIKVNDVVWTAVAENEHTKIEAGAIVEVVEIKGNKYVVKEKK